MCTWKMEEHSMFIVAANGMRLKIALQIPKFRDSVKQRTALNIFKRSVVFVCSNENLLDFLIFENASKKRAIKF